MQRQLAQVGITMSIQNLAGDAYIQDWLKGNFQAAFAENGADPSPYTMYGRYFAPGANLGVPAGYSDPQLQRAARAGRLGGDARREREGLREAEPTTSTANAVWLWLFDSYDYAVLSPKVHGFHLPPNRDLQSLRFATVS